MDLEIVNLTPRVLAGDNVVFTINLTNVGNITTFDTIMHKRIIKDNNIIVEKVVTRSMTYGLLVTDTLNVPKDLDAGRYFFEVYVDYVGRNASALMTFDVLKDCLVISGPSYDLLIKRHVIYTDSLKNVTLKFKNKCDFRLTNAVLYIDGSKIDIGTVPLEGFEIPIDFNRYGRFDIKTEYNEGYSTVNFELGSIAVSDFYVFLIALITSIAVATLVFRKYYRKGLIYKSPEEFKEKLKAEIIRKLKEKLKLEEEEPFELEEKAEEEEKSSTLKEFKKKLKAEIIEIIGKIQKLKEKMEETEIIEKLKEKLKLEEEEEKEEDEEEEEEEKEEEEFKREEIEEDESYEK